MTVLMRGYTYYYKVFTNSKKHCDVEPGVPGWHEKVMPNVLHSFDVNFPILLVFEMQQAWSSEWLQDFILSCPRVFSLPDSRGSGSKSERVELLQEWINKAVIWTLSPTGAAGLATHFTTLTWLPKSGVLSFLGIHCIQWGSMEVAREPLLKPWDLFGSWFLCPLLIWPCPTSQLLEEWEMMHLKSLAKYLHLIGT